jgi:hypothetical protein
MPRGGAIIFRDLVGKLDVLNVECEKCDRWGRSAEAGRDASVSPTMRMGDCTVRQKATRSQR